MMSNNWPEDMQPCPHCGKAERIEQIHDPRDDMESLLYGRTARYCRLRCGSCGFTTFPCPDYNMKQLWNKYPRKIGDCVLSDSAKTIGGGE